MIGLAIAAAVGSPIAFLAVGFLGVSRKRAEEGRAHITTPISTTRQSTNQPSTPDTTQPTFCSIN